MHRLMKCCARGALGLGAAALLLSGIPAHARAVSGPPDAQFRESQPCLLAQSKTQTGETEQLKEPSPAKPKKQAGMEEPQPQPQSQPKKMRTRGPIPEAAPAPAGRGRFGAGVIRDKDTKEVD
jgi:hypothetical protein